MTRSLTEALVAAHALARDGEPALRVDHALAGGDALLLALAAFEASGGGPARTEVALVCADSRTAHDAVGGARLQHAAARMGARFSPPGQGRADRIHLEALAAPGRVAVGCGLRPGAAGAMGMLAIEADAVDVAAAWAGDALALEGPRVVRVALAGALPPGCGGADLVLTLAASARAATLRGVVVEFGGDGVAAVPFPERVVASYLAAELGALTLLWPSDERTHEALRVLGRDADWKTLEAPADAPFDRAMDLEGLRPQMADATPDGAVRAVRDLEGTPVHAVVLGPGVPPELAVALARALAGRSGGSPVVVVPGSRSGLAALDACAPPGALAAAGVTVVEHGAGIPLAPPPEDGSIGLFLGIMPTDLPGALERWHLAGPATCAASALAGRLAEGALEAAAPVAATPGAAAPAAAMADEASAPLPGMALPSPPGDALRGAVLAVLGDDVQAADLLPWGPRLRPALGDVDALAGHVLGELRPGFAADARAAGGGFVVAGERFGAGIARDSAALALAALGVRAVLARSFAPAFERRLVASGVLPLAFGHAAEGAVPREGHELELPGLASGLEPGGTVAVRDLTDGRRYTARHGLDARASRMARAGGRLRALRDARATGVAP